MEDVVRSTAQPQMPAFSCFPPSAPPRRRRSHLDSDTYRTLARIFSHCLQSLPDSNPVASASPSAGIDQHGAKNPSETQNTGESCELDADCNGNSSPREDLGNNSGLSEDPVPEKPRQDDERRGCDDSGAKDTILNVLEEELGRDECDSGELLDNLIFGFAGLINVDDGNVAGGAKGSCLEGESIGWKRAAVEKAELVDSGSIGGLASSVSHSALEVIDEMLQSPQELQHGNVEVVERDECVSSELATEEADEKIAAVKKGIDPEGICLEGESIGCKRAAIEKSELVDSESIGGLASTVSHSTVEVIDEMLQTLQALQHGNVEVVEHDECVSSELAKEKADEKIAAVKKGIDQEGSCLEGESIESKRAAVEKSELVDSESIGGLASSVSHSAVEVIDEMLQTPHELQHGNVEEVERDECVSSELATEKADKKIAAVKKGIDQEARVCADSLIDTSVTSYLSEGRVTSLGGLLDDEETEEGQIPDEFQILEPCSDSDGGCSDLVAHNSEERSVFGSPGKRVNLGHTLVATSNINYTSRHFSPIEDRKKEDAANISNYDYSDRFMDASEKERVSKPENNKSFSNLLDADLNYKADVPFTSASSIQNKGKPDDAKDAEVIKKKKRGPLTEERKAKKKKAKKRKRAEKEREQGVKRLKLQPIIKPKTVKYCNYFLKGRCQQGDQCKFSHDVVPLTKSEPCRYFATGTCLKGDDCPFDHQLSKYPCHNFMSKGMCIRGDNCKFSHKMSENTLTVPMNGKSDTPLSSDKPTFGKELNIKKTSPANVSYTITTSRAQLLKPMHMEANLTENCLQPSVQTPSGIRFLSFGKGSSANAVKHQEKKINDNHSGNKLFNQSFSFSARKSLVGQCKREIALSVLDRHPVNNTGTHVELQNSNSNNELGASTSRSLESELSDATKILNEFLFGNSS